VSPTREENQRPKNNLRVVAAKIGGFMDNLTITVWLLWTNSNTPALFMEDVQRNFDKHPLQGQKNNKKPQNSKAHIFWVLCKI